MSGFAGPSYATTTGCSSYDDDYCGVDSDHLDLESSNDCSRSEGCCLSCLFHSSFNSAELYGGSIVKGNPSLESLIFSVDWANFHH